MELKLAYFGTPSFSAEFLENLKKDSSLPITVSLVVTQPDKAVGRKQIITPSPVKKMAQYYGIDLYDQPVTNRLKEIFRHKKVDLALVFAYGTLIPQELLIIPRYGFWNIHPSLLPQYRGPSPIAYPLILGDTVTGVTIMQVNQFLDQGPIIIQEKFNIKNDNTRIDLEKKLTALASSMVKTLLQQSPSRIKSYEQNHQEATYTKLLKRKDGLVPFSILRKALSNKMLKFEELSPFIQEYLSRYRQSHHLLTSLSYAASYVYNLYQGLYPWPGIWTLIPVNNQEKRLKIIQLTLSEENKLILNKVQLEGKKDVDFTTFNQAYSLFKS